MVMPNITGDDRAQALIAFHRQHAALEGDDKTILWHVVADLLDWCAVNQVNFDSVLADVKAES